MNHAVVHPAPYQTKFQVCDAQARQRPSHSRRLGLFEKDAIWKPANKIYDTGVRGLHEEILDFVTYISPTHEEHWVRSAVVNRVYSIVIALWPSCEVKVFGSYKTGLYLPTSDIDMVIFGKWEELPLRTLESALRNSLVASEIRVLSRATVPIVKLTDIDTGLHVDISFNMINSVHAADMICSYMEKHKALLYIVFVLKQFLLQRELNEVWTGGISSYALILMCTAFLQHAEVEKANLGTLLIEFFEHYGIKFNYGTTAIRVGEGGPYVQKEVVQQNTDPGARGSLLCIEDPLCPGNDVGRRSYAIPQVKRVFEYAYNVLRSAVLSLPHSSGGDSILARIIRISDNTLMCRYHVQQHARNLNLHAFPFVLPFSSRQTPPGQPVGVPIASQHNQTSIICSSNDRANSSTSSKDQIVVSARGFPAQPLLRPFSADLRLASPMTPYVFSPTALMYEANSRHGAFSLSAPGTDSQLCFILPHPFTAVHGNPFSLYSSQLTSQGNESTAMSRASESSSDDNSLSDPLTKNDQHLTTDEHDSGCSESQQKSFDIQQQSADRNKGSRPASASNHCSGLEYRLAPLRLASSEQNVSSGDFFKSRVDSLPIPISVDSGDSVISNQVECVRKEEQRPTVDEPNRNANSKGRCTRRRRRLPRISGNLCNAKESKVADETLVSTGNLNQPGMSSLKRRCSQLADASNRLRQSASSNASTCDEKTQLTDSGLQSDANSKVWFPIKSSVRTTSISPSKSDDQAPVHIYSRNQPAKCEQRNLPNSSSKKDKFSSSNVVDPPALKRLATGRPR